MRPSETGANGKGAAAKCKSGSQFAVDRDAASSTVSITSGQPYDTRGNMTYESHSYVSDDYSYGYSCSYTFDNFGNIIKEVLAEDDGLVYTYTYEYAN